MNASSDRPWQDRLDARFARAERAWRRTVFLLALVGTVLVGLVGRGFLYGPRDPLDRCLRQIDKEPTLRVALHRISVDGPWDEDGLTAYVCACADDHETKAIVPRTSFRGRVYFCVGVARAIGVPNVGLPFEGGEEDPVE